MEREWRERSRERGRERGRERERGSEIGTEGGGEMQRGHSLRHCLSEANNLWCTEW